MFKSQNFLNNSQRQTRKMERIGAFSPNRLSKKADAKNFEIGGSIAISPVKNSIYSFIYVLNRTIVNSPFIFWISQIISFIQLAVSVSSPYNKNYWNAFPDVLPVIKVFRIILRYVPIDSPEYAQYIAFGIYAALVLAQSIMIVVSIVKEKQSKSNRSFIYFVFIYSFFIAPLLRSSMASIFGCMLAKLVKDPSFGNFFISLIALIFLVLMFINNGFSMFAFSSAPNPNMSNPLACWAPDAICAVYFESILILSFLLLELTREVPKVGYGVYLLIVGILLFLFFLYLVRINYLISDTALEFTLCLYVSTSIFYIFLAIFAFISDVNMPLYLFLIIWIFLPMITFIVIRILINRHTHKVLTNLDHCGATTEDIINDSNPNIIVKPMAEDQEPLIDHQHQYDQLYQPLGIKNSRDAINKCRIACFYNHPIFQDITFVRYLLEKYPDADFSFIHTAYLNPDNYGFVTFEISQFCTNHMPSFLQECIMFQMINGIEESSNDLPAQIQRQISQQKLQAMKCQQFITKYWAMCYKGDITQMARFAFILYKHTHELDISWKNLVIRYPFSTPVLKEYVNYLQTTGMQHRTAEAIIKARPQLVDPGAENAEGKNSYLCQSVEEAVDRRPIYSLSKVRIAFIVSILISIVFLLAATIIGLVSFLKIKTASTYVCNIETSTAMMTHCPNLLDNIQDGYPTSRDHLFRMTTEISNRFNEFLETVPQSVFQESKSLSLPFYYKLNIFETNDSMTAYSAMRHIIYFARSAALAPSNDTLVTLVIKNVVNAYYSLNSFSLLSMYDIENSMESITKIAPYFYIACWVILLIVMLPLIFISLSSLEKEITYLFALYLTIPRSYINRLIDQNPNNKDRRNQEMLGTGSFLTHTTTTKFNLVDDKGDEDENIADGFKMLASEESNSFSVFPKFFIVKIAGLIFIISAVIAILSCISFFVFTQRTNQAIKCLYTIHYSSVRMMLSSLLLHGVTSNGNDIPIDTLKSFLSQLIDVNSAILYSTASYNLSNKALSSNKVHSAQFDYRCEDTSNLTCKNIIELVDLFINEISNITSYLARPTSLKVIQEGIDAQDARTIFNDHLVTKFVELTQVIYDYTESMMDNSLLIIILLFVIPIILLLVILLFLIKPIFEELTATIQSVKLPLKYIVPTDLPDMPRMMQYLQGECDWKRGLSSEKSNEEKSGNSTLNALHCPFAIFEEELALLFANSAFYSMLGTTREATVGLQMEEIFSPVMNYKENENHPFNALLETVKQLQRGVSPVKFAEINTDIDSLKKPKRNVMIRLVGLLVDDKPPDEKNSRNASKNKEHEANQETQPLISGNIFETEPAHNDEVDENTPTNFRAKQFAIFITDLSKRKKLETQIKYENELAQQLRDAAIPKPIANALKEGNELVPKSFKDLPVLIFSINVIDEEDGEDNLINACSNFLKTAAEISETFSSLTKVTHTPPTWIYASGISTAIVTSKNQNGGETVNEMTKNDLSFNTSELVNFALSIIEVFSGNQVSNNATLSALIHVGDITLLPINCELPFIDTYGSAYHILSNSLSVLVPNSVLATQEAHEVLYAMRDVTLSVYGNLKDDSGEPRTYYSVQRSSDDITCIFETSNQFDESF